MDSLLSILKERDRKILGTYIYSDPAEDKVRVLDAIGREFGIGRERVKQIIKDSAKKIRTELADRISREKARKQAADVEDYYVHNSLKRKYLELLCRGAKFMHKYRNMYIICKIDSVPKSVSE